MPRSNQPYPTNGPNAVELVELHAPLVKRIAHHLLARLPDNVLVDDLIQSGLEGLLEAANKYDASKGASFETFAGIRIRGAMLDEMRRGDWSPRSIHRNARLQAKAYQQVEAKLERAPTDLEVAEQMEISVQDYQTMARHTVSARLYSFDEPAGAEEGQSRAELYSDSAPSPEQIHEQSDERKRLAEAIGELPERDQLLLSLYYQDELNLKEIGKVLGVSESRVSQLHRQAALKLRAKLLDES